MTFEYSNTNTQYTHSLLKAWSLRRPYMNYVLIPSHPPRTLFRPRMDSLKRIMSNDIQSDILITMHFKFA